jgi:hypothetical protein
MLIGLVIMRFFSGVFRVGWLLVGLVLQLDRYMVIRYLSDL